METTLNLTIGPFFTDSGLAQQMTGRIVPLNLNIEWANPLKATRIPLFRERFSYAPDRIRFENILFHRHDLPCDIECQEHRILDTVHGLFLPLDILLAQLYRNREISRPIFQLLDELAAVVPLTSPVTNPISTKGLLATEAEGAGFRLTMAFHEAGMVYAHIGWQPDCRTTRFHVGVVALQARASGEMVPGGWIDQRDTGICQVLVKELQHLVPDSPATLLTERGMQVLAATLPKTHHEAAFHR